MTHNEKRQHWLKEGAIGLGTGVLYGITSVAVGTSIVLPASCPCVHARRVKQINQGFDRRHP